MKAMKKILTALLAVTMALALVSAAVAMDGNGTPDSPLQIGTANDLITFGERVIRGETTLWAELTADIDIIDPQWTITVDGTAYRTIGKPGTSVSVPSDVPYTGTFDGNGHKLKLKKHYTDTNDRARMALFHTIGAGGVVRNLNLDVDFSGLNYIAGVAVYNLGTIEYVTVDGSITATNNYIGGIASVNGNVTGTNDSAVITDGKILHCVNHANISANDYVGGIAGIDKSGEIRYCGNTGDITTPNGNVGGITYLIGTNDLDNKAPTTMIISDSYNAGTLYLNSVSSLSTSFSGGLFGGTHHILQLRADAEGKYEKIKFSNLFSYGNIVVGTADNASLTNIIGGGSASSSASGQDIVEWYDNVYYREGIGARLFNANNLNGADGMGITLVKTAIHGKTEDEFKNAEMAALLNNSRTGDAAPWEYVPGNDYPTLKADFDANAAASAVPPAKYVKAFYGGTVTYNLNGTYTITPTAEGYVIDEIWLGGKLIQGGQGLPAYTTESAPEIGVFATFGYSVNFNSPAGGTLSVSRVIGDSKSEIESGSIVHALEILSVNYEGSGSIEVAGLTETGTADEYKVTALRVTAGPTIVVKPADPGDPGNDDDDDGGNNNNDDDDDDDDDDDNGGNNDSGNTGGGTDEPGTPVTVTAPVMLPEGSVTIDPQTPNTASVAVPENSIETAINAALELAAEAGENAVATVEIDVESETQGVSTVSVQISTSGLEKIAESEVENVSVVTAIGTVTLDTEAMEALIAAAGGEENVAIAVERKETLEDGGLTPAQEAVLASDPNVREVYDISVVIDGDKRDFVTEGELAIGLPCPLNDGETGSGVWVYYIADDITDDGTPERMEKDRRYEDGKACFTTSHLSVYAVTYEATATEETEEGDEPYTGGTPYSDGGCNAGTGMAALAAMAAAVLAGKRRKD